MIKALSIFDKNVVYKIVNASDRCMSEFELGMEVRFIESGFSIYDNSFAYFFQSGSEEKKRVLFVDANASEVDRIAVLQNFCVITL